MLADRSAKILLTPRLAISAFAFMTYPNIIANGRPLEYWPVTNRISPSSTYSPTNARTPVL